MGQILDNGYELKTTFWRDFTFADMFGAEAIEDTFYRAFNEWKNNVVYVTELAMVMSWKACFYHNKRNEEAMLLYSRLYQTVDEWCMNNLKDKDLTYYIKTTD